MEEQLLDQTNKDLRILVKAYSIQKKAQDEKLSLTELKVLDEAEKIKKDADRWKRAKFRARAKSKLMRIRSARTNTPAGNEFPKMVIEAEKLIEPGFQKVEPQAEGTTAPGTGEPDELQLSPSNEENEPGPEQAACPQAENGHVDIANEIVEALAKTYFSSYESRVLWALFRQTYGWHKKTDKISITQFQEITGMDRRHVHQILSRLVQRKIVARLGNTRIITYGFQKDYTKWRDIAQTSNDVGIPRAGGQGRKKIVARLGNRSLLKQALTKETNQRKKYVEGSIELQLASFFLREIRRNKADFKQPNLQAWAKDLDLMLRVDKRSAEAVERVIRWVQADHGDGTGRWKGWSANILSPGKLRDKFDELEMKMQDKPKDRGPKFINGNIRGDCHE